MLQSDLEKRLEEIEIKIEELEDMILDNRLKIMDIFSKLEKKGPEKVRFEEVKKPKKRGIFGIKKMESPPPQEPEEKVVERVREAEPERQPLPVPEPEQVLERELRELPPQETVEMETPAPEPEKPKTLENIFKPKKSKKESGRDMGEIESLKGRARKIKEMLRELK
ncbi:MAG: hypothetical protein JSV92_03770 [archaeon]|nr:MAG: hypothetical protein JSV92_03770 [archaeon]